MARHDPQRFYWPSSPLAAWDGKETVSHASFSPQQSGDIHYWSVWWGQKPFAEYRTHIGRFMSEYGFQSFPEFRTIEAYTQPGDRDIFSEVMKAHQRSSIGNGTIKTYMERDYRVPADFRQFLYVGQVLQAEGIKTAMEAHRSRMPYCMGSLFWQINDCWPVASWSSIDYFGRWKAQQYFARKAFDTVLVSPQLDDQTVHIHAVSDLLADQEVTLALRLMDFAGKIVASEDTPLVLKANAASLVMTREVADLLRGASPQSVVLSVRLMAGGQVLAGNLLYFAPVKDLTLPKPAITRTIKASGSEILIGLTAGRLVKNLYLSLSDGDGDGRFSDNYFDMLPGEAVTLRFKPAKAMDAKTFETRLALMHMADIPAG
ncbi:MAG: glycoside hydrolase family 2 protein [Asticcacaulis sp.]